MKVVCIHKDNWSGGLTIGKTYEVTSYERLPNEYFLRLDDVYSGTWHNKDLFKTLSEIRNEKIDKLLN